MNYSNKKFFTEYNTLGINGHSQYSIKIDDDSQTPFAIVMLGQGVKDAKKQGKAKADYIVECLNKNVK